LRVSGLTVGTGRPHLDDLTVLNGIMWKFRTGAAGREAPQDVGIDGSLTVPALTP